MKIIFGIIGVILGMAISQAISSNPLVVLSGPVVGGFIGAFIGDLIRGGGGSSGGGSSSGHRGYRTNLTGSGRPAVCANLDTVACSGVDCMTCSGFEALDSKCKNISSACNNSYESCSTCSRYESKY